MERNYLVKKMIMECPLCDNEHEIEERRRNTCITIKGESIEYEELYFLCNNCDEDENEFVTAKMTNDNLMNARNVYRYRKGLLTSSEIIEIREQYGLSQIDLSNLLGWGEATISRYESKAIQDEAYDNILRDIKENPLRAYDFLQKNKNKFSGLKYLGIKEKIKQSLDQYGREYLKRQVLEVEYLNYVELSDINGYRFLDIDKLESVISYIAKRTNNLYKVKLMKMLWYADSLNFKKYGISMTGLVYCREKMGALPKGHYKILDLEYVMVDKEEDFDNLRYHILSNDSLDMSNLSSDELDILDMVINKFKNFTARELVDYMHKERAYLETQDGCEIPYSLSKEIREL